MKDFPQVLKRCIFRQKLKFLGPFFDMRRPCLKHRKKYLDDDEITKGTSIIHLPRKVAEAFWIEDDDIKENYKGQRLRKTYDYIVHNKCRCYQCDIIRSAAVYGRDKF